MDTGGRRDGYARRSRKNPAPAPAPSSRKYTLVLRAAGLRSMSGATGIFVSGRLGSPCSVFRFVSCRRAFVVLLLFFLLWVYRPPKFVALLGVLVRM